ncbi:MAG: universal stress protein [Bacteroidota bacterium]
MQRILVPTDFSKQAENALQTAVIIASKFNAKIFLLHVLVVSSQNRVNSLSTKETDPRVAEKLLIDESIQEAKSNIERSLLLHDVEKSGVSVESFIRIGNPIKEIERSVENSNIDLVIMGTKGAWGLNDILLGTNTDKLLRRVNCPVMAVNQIIPIEDYKKIVFPTTTNSKETNLIEIIKNLQQAFESKIHLVRINTPSDFIPDEESIELLNEYAEENSLKNYETHVYSHNEEEDGIREFARSINAGLIAVSTSAHTGLRKIIQGSVTKDLVSHSKRPVLTMKMD